MGRSAADEPCELPTAADVAQLLGTTQRYVWALGRRGLLPRVVLPGGRLVRFTRRDVDAMIVAGRERPDEQPAKRQAARGTAAGPASRPPCGSDRVFS